MRSDHRRDNPEAGFIIVPVLWILLALAGMAGILSVYLVNSAQALSLDDDHLRSAALVSAGLELTAYELSSQPKPQRPPSGSLSFHLDHARVSVSFRSEAARIDLNHASKEMLANFFQVLGARADDAVEYAARIVGWRTPPSENAPEAERALYRDAGVDHMPRGAPFANVEELRLVLHLPPALADRAMPFVTVYSGKREINALEAAPEVVASLPGMTEDLMKSFLAQRAGLNRDARSVASVLGPARSGATVEAGDSVRVKTMIAFDNGRQAAAEVIILLDGGDDPYKILSWRDDGGTAAMRRQSARAQ
ncbi:MAG TPA: type II secretion system protein GspK [Bradyrhizobium sp.]|nr:type II secretion system protein GspK [Bradyrhizobium sp.]